jgi:hypothetical protein
VTLKDLFSKEGRHERSLQKACAKAVNKKIKPEDRRPALWSLLETARAVDELTESVKQQPDNAELQAALETAKRHSEQAITALLARLNFIYDTNIVNDEEEKTMVYEGLVVLGDRILPQVRKYLRSAPTLSWGLRLLQEITDHETTWQVLSEVLQDYDPEYERDPSRKLQLMTYLGEFKDARAVDVLLPYLGDHDETVRFVTAEALFKQGDERAREPLLQLLTKEDEESLRIKVRIADGFCETGWNTKGFRGTVEKILPGEYIVDGKGRIKLKKARDVE